MLRTPRVSAGAECSLGCIYTYGYDFSRDNVNANESILKASTLTSLTATNSTDLNGVVYAEPLYVSQLSISGTPYDVLFVATEENYVYALNADNLGSAPLWSANLNGTNETAVPDSVLPGQCDNIGPEVGITGTPVIDTAHNVMYVVSKHYNTSTQAVVQRLNMLYITSGQPAVTAVDIGQALGTSNFSALNENQRAGLALVSQDDGSPWVYITWGSHCDQSIGTPAYTGWVPAFQSNGTALELQASFNDQDSNGSEGGIWMSGAAPAVTSAPESQTISDVYLATGNGTFNGTTSGVTEFGESVLRLHHSSSTFSVTGMYTPKKWAALNGNDKACTNPLNLPAPESGTICSPGDFDLDSGGVVLARAVGTGFLPPNDTFVVLAGGKEGLLYVLDPSNMSRTVADTTDPCSTGAHGQTIQCIGAVQLPTGCCQGMGNVGLRGSSAFWPGNSTYEENVEYVAGSFDSEIRAYQMASGGGGAFTTSQLFGYAPAPNPNSSGEFWYPGSTTAISWNANGGFNTDAILWILDTSGHGSTALAKLYAYAALPAQRGGELPLLFSDTTDGPLPTHFMVPTVVNGQVFVGGQKPNQSCQAGSCTGRVVVWQ